MNTNPYSTEDLEKILLRIPEPTVPIVLQLILLASDYEKLSNIDRDKLIKSIDAINNLDPNFSLQARNEIINALKLKKKKEKKSLARAVFQNRINELEQSKYPILNFERMISTNFSTRFLEETIKFEWGKIASHYKYINQWKYLFSKISFYKGDLPDDSFYIYRAGTKNGLSWTMDNSIAKWFYNKNLVTNKGKYNYFIKSYVDKSNIIFYLNHKNENEVVYIPDFEKIEYVSTDEIEEIPTINSPRNKRIARGEL